MPVGAVRVRGIKKVDVVGSSVGYFSSAHSEGRLWDTGLGGTGSRKGGTRGRATGGGHGGWFGGHWRKGRGKDGSGSVGGLEVHILVKSWADRIAYWISAAKLARGSSG